MKIFLAQQNYIIGDFQHNLEKIKTATQHAIDNNGDLILFPELSICGYPPRDLLNFEEFVDTCINCISELLPLSQKIAIIVGAPSKNPVLEGKALHNSAYFLHEGKIVDIINKTLLPNYDVFDEYRYFEAAKSHNIILFKGKKFAITICEDIWDIEKDPMYNYTPMDVLTLQHPDIMLNLSASPFNYFHANNRKTVLKYNALKYNIPIIYCNCTGSQTEIVFDGGSMVFDKNGNELLELPHFEEHITAITLEEDNNIHLPISIPASNIENVFVTHEKLIIDEPHIAQIHKALVYGIKEYFEKMGFKKAIVASSGGIDSAVTLALACEALGSDNVFALLLPSQYSTDHSVDDAIALSENLKNPYEIVAIKDIYFTIEKSLQPIFKDMPIDVTEENLQSRIRGVLTMALSNKFNYILLNTSNKSELATGYGTLYGDMAGGLAVLGDVFKQQVYALARYINKHQEIIPTNIINKAPSAELRPNQKDTDSLPPYEVLDEILYQYVERFQSVNDITKTGYDEALVKRIINMVNRNEYKRHQFCPIIRVSSKAFGIGRRLPIVGKYVV
jgi:NAD+ synthase (glutamine-hydrolysing)